MENATTAADWFELNGANVKRLFMDDFIHVFPNNLADEPVWNPSESCAIRNSHERSSSNCGLNLAKMAFKHLYGG